MRLADTHARPLAALDVYGRVAAQLLACFREHGESLSGGALIPLCPTEPASPVSWEPPVRVNQAPGYYRGRGNSSSTATGNVRRERVVLAVCLADLPHWYGLSKKTETQAEPSGARVNVCEAAVQSSW